MRRLLDWPVLHPRLALLLAGIVTVASVLLVLRLRPETSLQGMLDDSDPAVIAMGRVLDQYQAVTELLVLATLPDSAPVDDPAPLLNFAQRLERELPVDPEASALVGRVQYRAEAQARKYIEKVIVPNGLFYLDDAQLPELSDRLTAEGMRAQIARNESMLAFPGPAAGGLAKTLAKDPLRLHEFLLSRMNDLSIPGGSAPGSEARTGGAFLSPDRRSILIRIDGKQSPKDFNFAIALTSAVRRVAEAQNSDHLRLDIAGSYAIAAHSATQIRSDSVSDINTTIVGLVLLFIISCRRPIRLFTFAFVPVAAGLVWGFAAYALLRQSITPLAAVVGGTLGAIGLDYTIHYIAHYQERRKRTVDAVATVRRTSHDMFFPSLAAWMTSVIGFAAVGISPVRVLRDFSILGTLCLIGAWAATLLVLPAMLSWFVLKDAAAFEGRFGMFERIGEWIFRQSRRLLAISSIVVLVIVALLAFRHVRYEFNSDPMAMHPHPSPPLEAQRFIAQRMQVAAGALIVHLHADTPERLVSLAHVVQKRLKSDAVGKAGISGVFGLASLLPDPASIEKRRTVLGPDAANRVDANLKSALAESSFRPEAFDAYTDFVKTLAAPSDPPSVARLIEYPELAQLLLPRKVFKDATPTEAVTLLFSKEPLESREARESALTVVREALDGVGGATVTGTAVIGHDLEAAMHRDLPRFVTVSLVCILLYLLLHFRSLKLAALALLPIAISLVCVVAYVSLAQVKLSLIHAVAAPLLLGINLDYGIFAVHAWRTSHNKRELMEHFPAAFSALMVCGGSTLIGFGSLVVTSIPAVESLGVLINVGVGTCVLSTLVILWPVMMLSSRYRRVD